MEITLQARLAAIAEKSFDTKDGEHVDYNETYFQYQEEDGALAVAKCNTKQNLAQFLGKEGKAKISVQTDGKLKLIKFTPHGSTGDEDEETDE